MAKTLTKNEIVKCALDLSIEKGWARVTMSDIAAKSGMVLADLHDMFVDKTDILIAFGRMIDRAVLENLDIDEHAAPHERLFDLLMDRFDALNDYRDGVVSILESFKGDPKQAVITLPHLSRSISWMMDAAKIESHGIKGAMKLAGLTGVYLKTAYVWKSDDSVDLSKTMAALDKNLKKACDFGGMLGMF